MPDNQVNVIAMAEYTGIAADIENYDLTQSSSDDSSDDEANTPQPKRQRWDVDIAENCVTTPQYNIAAPSTSKKSPRKRPEPKNGYIYGFRLPFTVDNTEYCVVKIGKTGDGQIARRLRDHHSEFNNATGVPISVSAPTISEDKEIIRQVKWNQDTTVFLLSNVKDGLRAAEYGARQCIGVAPFNIVPTFKVVFPNSKRVTTTEWVVAKKEVVEAIQVEFWHDRMDSFESADLFLDKLRELNKRKHTELKISLETLDNEIYRTTVKAPVYEPSDSGAA